MENIDFERWLLEKNPIGNPLYEVFIKMFPYSDYFPKLEEFVIWLFDEENGFLFQCCKDYNFNENEFINDIEIKIKEYNSVEKALSIKILLLTLDWYRYCKSNRKLRVDKWEGGTTFRLPNPNREKFNSEKCIYLKCNIDYKSLVKSLKLKFAILNKNLPLIINVDNWEIEINKNYQETSTKAVKPQPITPIKLELNQTQIIYIFQQLVEKGYLKTNQNPKLWNLISKYFVDMNNKPMNNIRQAKYNLENTKKGKPKNAETIDEIISFLDTLKDFD